MRFYSNDTRSATITWYFVPDDTPFVPYPNVFTSRVWDEDHAGWDGVGEVSGAARTWEPGGPPPLVAVPGQLPCGTAAQWGNGQPNPPAVPVQLDFNGNLACCNAQGLPREPLAWWKADAITPLHNNKPVQFWPDSTGNGNDLSNGAFNSGPLYQVGSLGKLPYVVNNAEIHDGLNLTTPLNLPKDFMIYWVAQFGQGGSGAGISFAALTEFLNGQYYILQGVGAEYGVVSYGDSQHNLRVATSFPNLFNWAVFSYGRSLGDYSFRMNNRVILENVDTSKVGPQILSIGAFPPANYTAGTAYSFGEAVILPFYPTVAEDTYWRSYFAKRWKGYL